MTDEKDQSPADRVRIFDTTLRDGEQAPGFSMTGEQKIRMANALAGLGVDVIEAGYAAASPGDFDAVERIGKEVEGPRIASLARCNPNDINAAGRALKDGLNPRIHTFIATSPIHREAKLNMTKDEVLEAAINGVELARTYVNDVEFSAEDAIRTERDYLVEVFTAAVKAGATTCNVPDTVGYTTPEEIKDLFAFLRSELPDHVILSAHCHDDLGLAVANSLAAVEGGARQVECAVNGIGERAGNCSLEEVVMALRTRKDHYGVATDVDTTKIYGVSRLLSTVTGQPVQRNKAIVGQNAFAHEAGIHQHGVLKNPLTYEIMRAEDVGVSRDNLVLGKHSGRAALAARAERLGLKLGDNELNSVFVAFKDLADKKKEIFDTDVEALILGEERADAGPWKLLTLEVGGGAGGARKSYAVVEVENVDGRKAKERVEGHGPVDAAYRAINKITGIDLELEHYSVRSISEGGDAQAEADVHVRLNDVLFNGRGLDTDTMVASAFAYLDVINRIERQRERYKGDLKPRHPQTEGV